MIKTTSDNAPGIKQALAKLPGIISIGEINIRGRLIEHIAFESETAGKLTVDRLQAKGSTALFDFYFHGLSQESRNFFPPYPLFSPPVTSVEALAARITEWEKEDDWTFLNLTKDGKIIGVALLKRYKTDRPRSGLAVRENFQNKGLGFLLQTVITEQARMLGLKKYYATIAPGNAASLKVHKKCGLKETGRLVPHSVFKDGVEVVDRQDIELVWESK